MVMLMGNDSDNNLTGTAGQDTIRGKGGNDILKGLGDQDILLGGKDDDHIFGGAGNDVLSGDGDSITLNRNGSVTIDRRADKGNDVLVGGTGRDILVGWGDDILVGGGPDRYSARFIENLKNDPFETPLAGDKQTDTFIAVNKDGVGYTMTVVDYEVRIDKIDLRAYNVRGAADFTEIQDKGNFFEAKTPKFNDAEIVLRINVNPTLLTYVI